MIAAPGAALAERLGDLLSRRAEALVRAARSVRHGDDQEAIHDARVAARRLAAALSTWRAALVPADRRRAARRLRRLRRALGRARELEVHAELARSCLAALTPEARVALEEWLAPVERRMRRERRAAARLARPRRVARVLGLLAAARAGLEAVRTDPAPARLDAERRLRRAAERGAGRLQAVRARAGDDALHRARVAAKRWRYALECAGEAGLADRSGEVLERLKAVQTALGDAHDAAQVHARLVAHAARLAAARRAAGARALEAPLALLRAERGRAVDEFRVAAAALLDEPPAAGPGIVAHREPGRAAR